ncbi:MAG: hypothetical protein KDD76_05380 [Rickettsiales bacterium]|nr:hypothetical protein [Rickettsiales bacterium]
MKFIGKLPLLFSILIIGSLTLTGCSRHMGSTVYSSGATVGKVVEGTIVSAQPVTIKDIDDPSKAGLGAMGGGVVGGIGGSGLGKGKGSALAAAGGAIAGAIVGSLVEDELNTSQGMQYIVRLDPRYVSNKTETVKKKQVTIGNNSVDDEIKGSIDVTDTQTDLISIIQGADVVFQPGQHVMIVYHNDRPRITAATQ